MIIKNIKQLLSFKFILLTIIIFSIASISSRNLLIELIQSNYLDVDLNNISAFDILLSNFLLLEYEYNIKYFLQVLGIYIVPFLVLSNYAYKQIIHISSYSIIRLKSYSKFLTNLISVIVVISILYFTIGYITVFILNINICNVDNGVFFLLFKDKLSYLDIVARSFIINNLILISLVSFIVMASILFDNFNIVIGFILILFSIGILGKFKFLIGFHTILFNSINQNNFKISIETIITYLFIILLSIIISIYILKFEKHKLLNIDDR